MNPLRPFEEFIAAGVVRKRAPDARRARNLLEDSEKRRRFLEQAVERLGVDDDSANYYVEACYDILLQLIRARLLRDGYSASGEGGHEAEVAYLAKLKIAQRDVRFLNDLRYFRNGIKYYGERRDAEYAGRVLHFTRELYPQLRALAEKL